jgi:two-component system, OmpR family, phosphate regulon sensor histidine kinase PhoR
MEEPDLWTTANDIHVLWQRLGAELASIYDAHGVCASVAYEMAVYMGVKAVVALSGPLRQYYDVWICDPIGALEQTRWEGTQHAFAQLTDAREPLRLEKFRLPAEAVLGSDLWLLARDAVVAVPLPFPRRDDNLVPAGVLCLIDPPDDSIVDLENFGPLATHITTYLDRAFLRHERDRQQVEFDIVYDLTYSLTATLSLENIFSQLTDPVRRTLNVEAVSIGLVEPVTGDMMFVDSLMGPMFKDLPPVRLQAGQGIAGQVALSGEPLIVNNVYKDQRFFSRIDRDSGFHTDSILCVPLKVEQRVIGVLEAINKRIGNFHESDLRLLQAIASPLAAAIENARLHGDVLAEKRRVETIFASMSEGLLTTNAEGLITAANESLLTLLGIASGEALIGQPAQEAIHIEASETLAAYLKRVRTATDDYPQIACDLLQPEGEPVPVLISGASVQDESGELAEMILTFSDLRQIREVERMRDDFFHNIVHELRTPLATILMYARLLREGKAQGDDAKQDRFLGVIERESDRLQRMVRQMLQLAKLEARELQRSAEVVNLNDVFDDILPPLADRAMEKGLTFVQRIPESLPPILGNEEMIYSAFKNLVENAVKFTMSGTVRVEATADEEMVEVVVRDDGIGVPDTAKPNLFKRFYRAQTAVERGIAGTGLGLYMVKEAVVKHNGTIRVESVEGEGTTFTIRLPATQE